MTEYNFLAIDERFQNGNTEDEIDGVTIIISGSLQKKLEQMISFLPNYNKYSEIIKDCLCIGLNDICTILTDSDINESNTSSDLIKVFPSNTENKKKENIS